MHLQGPWRIEMIDDLWLLKIDEEHQESTKSETPTSNDILSKTINIG